MESKNLKVEDTKLEVKTCSTCKTDKPVSEFGKLAASKDGYLSFCKECNRARNKEYRSSKKTVKDVVPVTSVVNNEIDWDSVPVRSHDVRIKNDCSIGDYFKNLQDENFVLKITEWDNDEKGQRKDVKTHNLYVKGSEWKEMLSFPESEKMKAELSKVKDSTWSDFVFHYTKKYFNAKPENLVRLRFKKCGSTGKCVNVGINTKDLPKLTQRFSR